MKIKQLCLFIMLTFLTVSGYQMPAPYYIIVDKSEHTLFLFLHNDIYKKYHVVFGNDDMGDKMFEGDRKTPDGTFVVIFKKKSKDWGPELILNYPTEESYSRFKARKDSGIIPKGARIGSSIAIHGTIRSSTDKLIDSNYNWTNGCIALKLREMEELYKMIHIGTEVFIKQ